MTLSGAARFAAREKWMLSIKMAGVGWGNAYCSSQPTRSFISPSCFSEPLEAARRRCRSLLDGVGHQAAQLLRLQSVRLHLALGVMGLQRDHVLDVLGVGQRTRQSEAGVGVLLGETHRTVL